MTLVLLAVADGGPLTSQLIETSLQLRAATSGYLDLVHVRDPSLPLAGAGSSQSLAEERAATIERIWSGQGVPPGDAEFHLESGSESEILVARAHVSDLSVVARPGADEQRPEPAYVQDLVFRSGRPVLVVPPTIRSHWLESALIVWNGSEQASRAVAGAMPLLKLAGSVTVACFASERSRVPTDGLLRYLRRHGIPADAIGVDPGGVSARGRGRAIVSYAWMTDVGFTVMGAYGDPGVMSFLGLGGATGKVITATRTPLLLAG